MVKPYSPRELSARLKALLRRTIHAPAQTTAKVKQIRSRHAVISNDRPIAHVKKFYINDGWCLDTGQHQLFDDKARTVNLTCGEFRLLLTLVSAPKQVFTRDQLLNVTRDSDNHDTFDRAIDIQIARLRKKLRNTDLKDGLIQTVRGVGYMFSGTVKTKKNG